MNIILIWLRGVGKTYYWKLLSKEFWYDFIDTDDLIEKRSNLKIFDIINKYWWDEFRSIEHEVVNDIVWSKNSFISTWWWLPCYFDNAIKIKKLWKIIWLKASIDYMIKLIWKSYKNNRPSITWKSIYEEIEDLINIRYPVFDNIADITIDTEINNKEQIISLIRSFLYCNN